VGSFISRQLTTFFIAFSFNKKYMVPGELFFISHGFPLSLYPVNNLPDPVVLFGARREKIYRHRRKWFRAGCKLMRPGVRDPVTIPLYPFRASPVKKPSSGKGKAAPHHFSASALI
jgi:hypothetical protein